MKAIGIDIGTTSISGVLYSVSSNNLIKSLTKNSNAFIQTENSWEKIQNVEKIIGVATEILNELLTDNVAVIGVTGQMHGIVYYDKNGSAVSPLYTWQDGRGNLPYKNSTYAEFLKSSSGYGCVTDFYNRENGLVPVSAVGFCSIADYLAMNLCGVNKPIIHSSNAGSFGCFDLEKNEFINGCKEIVTSGFKIVGKYKGVPVSVAIGDNQASVLATCKNNGVLFNVGTGSQVSIVSDKIKVLDNVETRPYFENKYLLVGSALCGGRAYSLVKDFIRDIISEKTEITDSEVYQIMARFLERVKTPSITADTRFAGTRADKTISGSFSGVTTENFKPSEFIASVLYGMVEELYGMYESFGEKRACLIGSGNGVKNNKRLVEIAEEKFGVKMEKPSFNEEASFGAMLYGLIAIGKFSTVSEAQQLIKYE